MADLFLNPAGVHDLAATVSATGSHVGDVQFLRSAVGDPVIDEADSILVSTLASTVAAVALAIAQQARAADAAALSYEANEAAIAAAAHPDGGAK